VTGANPNGVLGINSSSSAEYGSFLLNPYLVMREGEIIKMMAISSQSSSLLTSQGLLFTWGYNTFFGKLGTFSNTTRYLVPQLVQF
jgi:alpha-tubulin suppressor-like RCC1 family protein